VGNWPRELFGVGEDGRLWAEIVPIGRNHVGLQPEQEATDPLRLADNLE
jgi:hypothetical protein